MPRLTTLFIMLFPAGAALAQSNCASYEPAASLEGRLGSAVAFGPPGYGETPKEDTREHYLVVMFGRPLCVSRGEDEVDEAENAVARVQLVYSGNTKGLKSGARVRVTEKLFHAHTGHHHTAVLIDVSELAAR
jgi:hypothetical protein